jgi:hypothetical protein
VPPAVKRCHPPSASGAVGRNKPLWAQLRHRAPGRFDSFGEPSGFNGGCRNCASACYGLRELQERPAVKRCHPPSASGAVGRNKPLWAQLRHCAPGRFDSFGGPSGLDGGCRNCASACYGLRERQERPTGTARFSSENKIILPWVLISGVETDIIDALCRFLYG